MQGLTSVLPSHWHHSCKSHAEMNVLFATRWCRLGVLWRFGCGQTLEHRPQPSGGTVHSSPQRPGLYCYDCEPLWKISSHSWQRGNTQDVGHTGRFFFFYVAHTCTTDWAAVDHMNAHCNYISPWHLRTRDRVTNTERVTESGEQRARGRDRDQETGCSRQWWESEPRYFH